MRRSHHLVCGAGIVLALGYLLGTGGSAGGVGLLIAALVCPLAMVLAMSVLMRSDHRSAQQGDRGAATRPASPVERT